MSVWGCMRMTGYEDHYTETAVAFFLFPFQRFGMAARDLISWRWAHLAQKTDTCSKTGLLFCRAFSGCEL